MTNHIAQILALVLKPRAWRRKRRSQEPAKPRRSRRKPAAPIGRAKASRRKAPDALLAPIKGATAREIGGVRLDVASAGAARVKRMIYPPGFNWSSAMKPIVGTDRCMHAHVGFLARGEIHIEYADGCVVEYKAPRVPRSIPATTAGSSAKNRSS